MLAPKTIDFLTELIDDIHFWHNDCKKYKIELNYEEVLSISVIGVSSFLKLKEKIEKDFKDELEIASIMEEKRACKDFDKFQDGIKEQFPDLCQRVFILRTKGYMGCGFHYDLEKKLGKLIVNCNDYNDPKRYDHANRISFKVSWEIFIKRLEEIEKEISEKA